MFQRAVHWGLEQWEQAKSLPDVNSRISFLLQSSVGALCMLILTIGFLFHGVSADYAWVMAAVAGHAGANAWGRSKTKAVPEPEENKVETKKKLDIPPEA